MVLVRAPSALSPTSCKGDGNVSEGHRATQGQVHPFYYQVYGEEVTTWRLQHCTRCSPTIDREVGMELNPGL